MRTLFIVNDARYGSERSCNALCLAQPLSKAPTPSAQMFPLGNEVACAKVGQHGARFSRTPPRPES